MRYMVIIFLLTIIASALAAGEGPQNGDIASEH